MNKQLYNLLLIIASTSLYFSVIAPLYNGAGDSLLYLPKKGIATLMEENNNIDSSTEQAKSLSKKAKDLRLKYENIDSGIRDRLLTMVPTEIDPVRLVNEVNTIANSSGFTLESITYSQNETSSLGDNVKSYTFDMITIGTYAGLKTMIRNFENSLRLYSVKSIVFASPDLETGLTSFQVKLETYYLK